MTRPMPIPVYITIDTENSMGGAVSNPSRRPVPPDRRIYCRIEGRDYGIGWICAELNRRNLRATFFGEVFGSFVFGRDDTRSWFQYLLDNGQDIQLHTHPIFYCYANAYRYRDGSPLRTDNLTRVPPQVRLHLLEIACEEFRRAAGYDPVAFRAGNWNADGELLSDLRRCGIVLDASFNETLHGRGSFDGLPLVSNTLQLVNGVWELPLTAARQGLPGRPGRSGLRPFDPVSMSCWEMRRILDHAHECRATHVAVVFHSFSGVKAKDPQYSRMRPDRVFQKRLRFLLDYLHNNRDRFQVATLAGLAGNMNAEAARVGAPLPNLGFAHPLGRAVIQAINRSYWF